MLGHQALEGVQDAAAEAPPHEPDSSHSPPSFAHSPPPLAPNILTFGRCCWSHQPASRLVLWLGANERWPSASSACLLGVADVLYSIFAALLASSMHVPIPIWLLGLGPHSS